MEKLKGIAVSQGIAIGEVRVSADALNDISPRKVDDAEAEAERFLEALEIAKVQLDELSEKAKSKIGSEEAMIFEAHKLMLDDLDYLENIKDTILNEGFCAEYAVKQVGEAFAEMFSLMDDEYMQARSLDVKDISNRVIRILQGIDSSEAIQNAEIPYIVCAKDLFPSDTMQMDFNYVLAFVTKEGSRTSHTAIVARTLGIPAVLGLQGDYEQIHNGQTIVVDGFEGEVIIEPDEKLLMEYGKKQQDHQEYLERLKALKGMPSQTIDGMTIEICANIGSPEDVESALDNGAEGIGLFRSEFLFMESDDYPSEQVQMEAYQKVLAKMKGKRVVVRTFDIGADKTAPYMRFPEEENPALGQRAIRFSLRNRELFKVQLRALLRASLFGRLAIMFPMISDISELRQAKALLEECKKELDMENIRYSDAIEVGMMVEVPSAALTSDLFAKEVDFFSIGTNDLTQYTLAADRMNAVIAELYNTKSPAVLRLIEMTSRSARENGIWCGICGESGSDISLTEEFLRMGITELSVTPNAVLEVREKVRSLDLKRNNKLFKE